MQTLEEVIEYFKDDHYAMKTTGIELIDVRKEYAKCKMPITTNHRNAMGGVMGGAIFTLGDFAFGVAANCDQPLTVSLNLHIHYLNMTKGTVLYAEAHCNKSGGKTCHYTVVVTDDLGVEVARLAATGMRVSDKSGPELKNS